MGFFDLDKLFGDERNYDPVPINTKVLYITLTLCMEKHFEVKIECEHKGMEYEIGIKKDSQKKIALYLDDKIFDTMAEFKDALQKSPLITKDRISVCNATARRYPFF